MQSLHISTILDRHHVYSKGSIQMILCSLERESERERERKRERGKERERERERGGG